MPQLRAILEHDVFRSSMMLTGVTRNELHLVALASRFRTADFGLSVGDMD